MLIARYAGLTWSTGTAERRVRLGQLVSGVTGRFHSAYDFGDGWAHDVVVETVFLAANRVSAIPAPSAASGRAIATFAGVSSFFGLPPIRRLARAAPFPDTLTYRLSSLPAPSPFEQLPPGSYGASSAGDEFLRLSRRIAHARRFTHGLCIRHMRQWYRCGRRWQARGDGGAMSTLVSAFSAARR
ncbi:MAG: IS1096 element passenger TnpR family protein [Thermomicrobiales bacterium]